MEIRKISLSDMFNWVNNTFRLVWQNKRSFAFASLATFLPLILVGFALGLAMAAFTSIPAAVQEIPWRTIAIVYGIAVVLCLLFLPPLYAGWFTLCQKTDRKQDSGIGSIFEPYKNTGLWQKLIVYSLLVLVAYVTVHAAYILACLPLNIGEDFNNFIIMQLSKSTEPASLSVKFWIAYFGIIFIGYLLNFSMMLGFVEASLTDNSALDSFKKAITSGIKNIFNYIILLITISLLAIIAALAAGIVIGLIGVAIGLIGNSILNGIGIGLLVLLYLIFLLYLLPLFFGFSYFAWKGILGNEGLDETHISDSEVSA